MKNQFTPTKSLLKILNRLLKPYYAQKEERLLILEQIVSQFSGKASFKFVLNDEFYLILVKNSINQSCHKRYPGSPFPYLSNVEKFYSSLGDYNTELSKYGLKYRLKEELHESDQLGSHIFLSSYHNYNKKGNTYLYYQYKRLERYRNRHQITEYWNLCLILMNHSWIFRIASLNSWKPTWYKELSYSQLHKIWVGLNKILNYTELTTQIRNVWIESPRGKYRQLCIPPRHWRLFLHMLNNFLSYIYEPHLDPREQEGFIFKRGCLSWWRDLLINGWLERFPFIMEVDLSSAFPSIQRTIVRDALRSKGLIPPSLLNWIMQILNSPLKESNLFPTFESYAENKYNTLWRKSTRNLAMGLGTSPLLFVITLDWLLKRINLLSPNFKYKFYADDGTFFFNITGFLEFLKIQNPSFITLLKILYQRRNLILGILNNNPLLETSGVEFCSRKSRLVRFQWIWINDLKSLGLRLWTPLTLKEQLKNLWKGFTIPLELSGNTRGRGTNLSKGHPGTKGSQTHLNFLDSTKTSILNLSLLRSKYHKYLGLIMSELYASKRLESPSSSTLPTKSNLSIYSLFMKKINILSRKTKRELGFNKTNFGSKLNDILLKTLKKEPIELKYKSIDRNLYRQLFYNWEPNNSMSHDLIPPLADPLATIDPNLFSLQDKFRKYSELNLSKQEFEHLKLEYANYRKSSEPI